MRVTLAQLEAFYWIVRLGSFREAARHIGRTQPSISLRVRELEAALGARVLDRDGPRLRVTATGARLIGYADRFLGLTEELEANVRSLPMERERIRVGAIDSYAMTCLPRLLRAIEQLLPNAHVEVTVDYSFNLRERLKARELDICFLIDPETLPFLSGEYLCSINQIWVGAAGDRWRDTVHQPRDLADTMVFTLPQPAAKPVHDWFAAGGVEPTRVSVCNNLGIMVHLIRASLGIGLLPRCVVQSELHSGAMTEIRVSPSVPPSSLHLVHLQPFPFRLREVLAEARAIAERQGDL